MIHAFEFSEGAYRARLERTAVESLIRLIDEVLAVLDDPGELSTVLFASTQWETDRETPEGGALSRMLPPMSLDTRDAASLRALTEDSLRADKSSRLRAIREALDECRRNVDGEVVVGAEVVWDWLAGLNDLRLALAGELGLASDADAERIAELARQEGDPGPECTRAVMYVVITWWQDSLLGSLNS